MKEIEREISQNIVLSKVQETLTEQTSKGLEKYGTTVNYYALSASEWIEHARQETADKLVYLTCLGEAIQSMEAKVKAFDAIHGIMCDLQIAGTLNEEDALKCIVDELRKAFENVPEVRKQSDEIF